MPPKKHSRTAGALLIACLPFFAGCQSVEPLPTVDYVDLERFSGDWYVIASIPTFIEKGAHKAIERYELTDQGTIATTFSYLDGSFDGPRKQYTATGYVRDETSNAVWGMQFIWPFKADYRIAYLDQDYTLTVIGRNKRDYVWIMAREPSIAEAEYERLVALIETQGYDASAIIKVPQKP
jgi:apolipoprotein D and lipocalin family protein